MTVSMESLCDNELYNLQVTSTESCRDRGNEVLDLLMY